MSPVTCSASPSRPLSAVALSLLLGTALSLGACGRREPAPTETMPPAAVSAASGPAAPSTVEAAASYVGTGAASAATVVPSATQVFPTYQSDPAASAVGAAAAPATTPTGNTPAAAAPATTPTGNTPAASMPMTPASAVRP